MSNCGEPPKLVAFGIAPLGIISIGIVPMGVVSIGVVPMGVLSLGVVGMGVVNACVVGMGVVVAGLNAMGIWSLSPPGNGHQHHSRRTNRRAHTEQPSVHHGHIEQLHGDLQRRGDHHHAPSDHRSSCQPKPLVR